MSPLGPGRVHLARGATAIRPFARGDLEDLLELRRSNRTFMAPYEAVRSDAFFTRAGQAREIALDAEAWTAGAGYAFAVLATAEGERDALVGRIALSNVVRGPWQNATVGYWIDQDAGGHGHATDALRLTCRFAFEHLGLHRLQPAIMPRNTRSQRVVEKAGFRHEGTALGYLKIAGTWEDHHIYALTREEWRAGT